MEKQAQNVQEAKSASAEMRKWPLKKAAEEYFNWKTADSSDATVEREKRIFKPVEKFFAADFFLDQTFRRSSKRKCGITVTGDEDYIHLSHSLYPKSGAAPALNSLRHCTWCSAEIAKQKGGPVVSWLRLIDPLMSHDVVEFNA